MRDRSFVDGSIFGYQDTDRPVFASLREFGSSLDFSEAMVDAELVSVADGIKRMMDELELSTAADVAAVLGHEVKEVSMPTQGLGITSRPNTGETDSPLYINKAKPPRSKEFGVYHELGHQILLRFASDFYAETSSRQEEVLCDAFACLMIGNNMPPRPLKPARL